MGQGTPGEVQRRFGSFHVRLLASLFLLWLVLQALCYLGMSYEC